MTDGARVSPVIRGKPVPVDVEVGRLAHRQYGVVARRQLRALGLTDRAIDHRIGLGHLHVVHRGVLAVGHCRLGERGVWMAAVLFAGSRACLSHQSAAALWDFCPDSKRTHVLVPGAGTLGCSEIVVHRSRWLQGGDIVEHEGISVTEPVRTLLDLSSLISATRLKRAVEAADRSGRLDFVRLVQLLEATPRRHGSKAMRRTLAASGFSEQPTRSELERRFLELCGGANLPAPQVNVMVSGYEVDAYWPTWKLIVELDGFEFHRTRAAFERDRERDIALQLAGFKVLRFTWRRLQDRPETAIRALRACRPR